MSIFGYLFGEDDDCAQAFREGHRKGFRDGALSMEGPTRNRIENMRQQRDDALAALDVDPQLRAMRLRIVRQRREIVRLRAQIALMLKGYSR